MKFNIGDKVFWVESSTHYGKQIPCPLCFGKRFVTIILGDDSQTKIQCGYCEKGCSGTTGFATVWEPMARVNSGTITGVSLRDGIRYEVGSKSLTESDLFAGEQDAESLRLAKFEEEKARAEEWFRESFIQAKKKQIWSAGYHRNNIKQLERSIEWHKLRLRMIKDPAPGGKE